MSESVLIINHDPLTLELLTRYLQSSGHQVYAATNGAEAMRLILEHMPPVCVIDLEMPNTTPGTICTDIREQAELKSLFIIGVTDDPDEAKHVRALDAGADDVLTRPFGQLELLARIRVGFRIVALKRTLEERTRDLVRNGAELEMTNRQLRRSNEQLRQLIRTDDLTGLLNRRAAMEALQQRWSASVRHHFPFVAMLLDIDHFKQVNDAHGHDVGDRVLVDTAMTLATHTRVSEPAFRIGGEEFLVLCEQADIRGACSTAERLRSELAAMKVPCNATTISVTISVGLAERKGDMTHPDQLLKAADDALYAAKGGGRNCVYYVPADADAPVLYEAPPARLNRAS